MKLSYGQIQNLYKAMPMFNCPVCGDDQKKLCEEKDECQLIYWIVDLEISWIEEHNAKIQQQLDKNKGE